MLGQPKLLEKPRAHPKTILNYEVIYNVHDPKLYNILWIIPQLRIIYNIDLLSKVKLSHIYFDIHSVVLIKMPSNFSQTT